MNIFQTFETFLALPLSIIRERFIQILHLDNVNIGSESKIGVDLNENIAQITVYNSEKMYNLLSCVEHKKKMKLQNENNKRKIYS